MTSARSLPATLLAASACLLLACQDGRGTSPTEPALPFVGAASASVAAAEAGAVDDGDTFGAPDGERRGQRAASLTDRQLPPAAERGAGEGASAATAAARGGNRGGGGRGNGNGNGGGNGGGGNGGGHQGSALSLQIQPDSWNVNWEHSQGTVSALVRGADARKIDRGSVVLIGDGGGEVQPLRTQLHGGQLRAFFSQAEAFASLDDPEPRETHEVRLRFTVDGGAAQELVARVRIVGSRDDEEEDDEEEEEEDDEEDEEELEIEAAVQPATWNLEWSHSSGTVSVVLRGDVDEIVRDTLILVGSAGVEVPPVSVKRSGHHLRARFAKAEALASLDDPDAGETHEIEIRFTDEDGNSHALTLEVRIVGKSEDD